MELMEFKESSVWKNKFVNPGVEHEKAEYAVQNMHQKAR